MRVLFWGTPDFAVPTLRALVGEGHEVVGVVTQPDRPAGRGRRLQASPVREVAESEGIPLLTPDLPRGDDFMNQLRELDPEISVVVAYGHILKPEVLELPPRGSWNLHASLLPALRGAAPIHWAIARGHDATGVSVMRMTEGMDAGPVLHQVVEPIGPTETSDTVTESLAEIGAQAMIEALALLEFGDAEPVEQDHDAATYAPKVSREVARIDWTRSAREVIDHIRAMDSIPGAWTTWQGQPLKLFRPTPRPPRGWDGSTAAFFGGPASDGEGAGESGRGAVEPGPGEEGRSPDGPREDGEGSEPGPGTVLVADTAVDGAFAVRAADGPVWIGEVQPPGKKRMPVEDWLRGRGASPGARLE